MTQQEAKNSFHAVSQGMYRSGVGRDVKLHNKMAKKLRELHAKIPDEMRLILYTELLRDPDEKTRLNAATCCLSDGVLTGQAAAVLTQTAERSENEQCRVTAAVALRAWRNGMIETDG